tara:strand:+ start:392 stop:631 length:240 start_codon:yes stop_codon:yes gene_type:complete
MAIKEYTVNTVKSDKIFCVEVELSKERNERITNEDIFFDTFCSEKEALDHAEWWTQKSGLRNDVESVLVTQIIRQVIAK